jgi:hypothetical protein
MDQPASSLLTQEEVALLRRALLEWGAPLIALENSPSPWDFQIARTSWHNAGESESTYRKTNLSDR